MPVGQGAAGHAISIHALREEGDHSGALRDIRVMEFLSTPSVRRATSPRLLLHLLRGISIHALREEGDSTTYKIYTHIRISIHALREEGDRCGFCPYPGIKNFYPRPPRGGRRSTSGVRRPTGYFYPRPPRGGRLSHIDHWRGLFIFLSTPSARRATTWQGGVFRWDYHFYPRPPRGGRQRIKIWVVVSTPYFYPRPPRGGRRSCCLTFSVCS